jgi:hypothetical protein
VDPDFGRAVYYRDGKTASVAVRVQQQSGIVTILTNGKPDAGIRLDPSLAPTPDEYTVSLVAVLPLLIKPDAKTFANIGWGSGLTVEAALSHSGPQVLDSIEIEPVMYAGASTFARYMPRAYSDERSHIYFEDAKSYFARHGKRYDVIMAEPSNPWVNGVAGLFTTEFYRDTRRYLAPGGVFVQWLQGYEFNDRLMGSIFAALGENFSDYEIYEANPGDLLIVAVAQGQVPPMGPLPEQETAFREGLKRLGITRVEGISARSLGHKRQIEPLLAALAPQVNSDFRPVVQLEAPRARFQGSTARAVQSLAIAPVPVLEMAGGARLSYLKEPAPAYDPSPRVRLQSVATEIARLLSDRTADPLRSREKVATEIALMLRRPEALCGDEPSRTVLDQLQTAAETTLGGLPQEQVRALWVERKWLGCTPRSQHVRARLDVYAAIAARDPRAMLERARALLAGPAQGGDNWGRYLLGTAMLGAYAAGDSAEALRLWNAYRDTLYRSGNIPPYVSYLLALQAGRPLSP